MDIKRAKQEIKDSIEAYLAKDEFGEYLIPAIRQRPILLMGAPALREAAHIINGNDFRESDIVLISDFEMPPLSRDLMEQVKVIKRRKTSFFGLVFGNKPEMEYLNLCERYWEM